MAIRRSRNFRITLTRRRSTRLGRQAVVAETSSVQHVFSVVDGEQVVDLRFDDKLGPYDYVLRMPASEWQSLVLRIAAARDRLSPRSAENRAAAAPPATQEPGRDRAELGR